MSNTAKYFKFKRHTYFFLTYGVPLGKPFILKRVEGQCTTEWYFSVASPIIEYEHAELLFGLFKRKHKICLMVVPKKDITKEEARELVNEHMDLILSKSKALYRWLYNKRLTGTAGTLAIYKKLYVRQENEAALGTFRGSKSSSKTTKRPTDKTIHKEIT